MSKPYGMLKRDERHKILRGIYEWKKPLERPRYRWQVNIKMNAEQGEMDWSSSTNFKSRNGLFW
jgi:hypothetical protein